MTDLEALRREYADDPLLSELIEELRLLRKATTWRPIETMEMPKPEYEYDASTQSEPVIVSGINYDGSLRVGEAIAKCGYDFTTDEETIDWFWANDSCDCCWVKMKAPPTHWLPLPQPKEKDDG